MGKAFCIEEISSTLEEILYNSGEISLISNTSNMLPLFREKDIVTFSKLSKSPKQNDVVLYKNENNSYSISRVMFVNGEALVLCGDNKAEFDYSVHRNQIVGVMVSFDRKGKTHKVTDKDYELYVKSLPATKEARKYSFELLSRAKDFIKYLKKR